MEPAELFVTVECGGTIAENERGHWRVMGKPKTKAEATKYTRKMSQTFGGGYYDYHYKTVPLAWAIKYANYKEEES